VPKFVAVFEQGVDHLLSVERIQWNAKTDRIVLGKGVDLLEDDRVSPPNARLDGDDVRIASITAEDLAGPTAASTGGAGADRIVGGASDDVVEAGAGDDTLYGAEGEDILIGGSGSDGYVYLPGDGDDVIIDLSDAPEVDELVLAGGIEPGDVRVMRVGADDLLLSFADGSIRVCGYFASPHAGIERVLFDHAPPWTREDIELRAIDQQLVVWPGPDWHDTSNLVLGAEWQDGASAQDLF
jgi:Ca2+-binding RTX toxin-like protein